MCSNNVSLSTFGRRPFQSVDGDPEVAPHLPLSQATCLSLADERWAAMQRLPSHSAPLVVDSLQMAFQILGSGGPHLFKRHYGCLSGRWRTLDGITPAVIDNKLKTTSGCREPTFRLNAASGAPLSWVRQKEIQITHLHFYIEPRQCLWLKESSSSWKSCSLGFIRQPSNKRRRLQRSVCQHG